MWLSQRPAIPNIRKKQNDRRETWGTAVQKLFHFGIPLERIRGLNMVDYSRAIELYNRINY